VRTDAYWLGVASGFIVVGVVVEMVRRRYLRGRFALVWVALGVGAIVVALFPALLDHAASALGVTVPLNLLLFLGSIAMLIMIMQLSSESGRLRERTRVLAEEIALLRAMVEASQSPDEPGHGSADAEQATRRAQRPEPAVVAVSAAGTRTESRTAV
jgi:hypothetical protein